MADFDMVWGFPRDYLHGDLLGNMLHLWEVWTDPQSPIHFTKQDQDKINLRLMKMAPPQEIHRHIRPLATEKCKWKASEWRSFLLFYAIPCLIGILDEYALKHFALFVSSMYTLLKSSITEEELRRTEYDLFQFVCIFEVLYGEKYVTFNLHALKHCVKSVRYSGPTWSTSTFSFENAIYYLKEYVNGPKGVYDQMANKTLQANVFQSLVTELVESPNVLTFCDFLFARNEVTSFCRTSDVILVGRGVLDSSCKIPQQPDSQVFTFNRCIFSKMVIHSSQYSKPEKSNDTIFRLQNEKFVQVLNLLYCNETAYAKVVYFKVNQVCLSSAAHDREKDLPVIEDVQLTHLFKVEEKEGNEIIKVTALLEKCVLIKIGDSTYISTIPNTVEIQ